MAFIYVLKSTRYSKTYVGSTVNLDLRINEHNAGKSTFTKKYMPWQLVYKEEYANLYEARLREKYLKAGAGRRFLKEVLTNIPR